MELAANPNWWGGKVPVQHITVKFFSSETSEALAMRAGEIDVAFPTNGTSFASAFVAGVAALVRSAHPGLSPAQVVTRIEATAHGPAGPGTGYGLVDPVRSVTAVLSAESGAASTGAASTGAAAVPARTGTVAVIAGSFGLVVVVAAAVLAVFAVRRRRSGRHAR